MAGMLLTVADDIKNWKGKPKELIVFLSEKTVKQETPIQEALELLNGGSKTEKGIAADVIEGVSKAKPELLRPYIPQLIEHINDKVPKVKWGIPEAIGNLSQKYPEESAKAVPNLLTNTKDESTVVKWCAAFALSEIAKNNISIQDSLVPKMKQIAEDEKNNGVRNVYLKALKKMKK